MNGLTFEHPSAAWTLAGAALVLAAWRIARRRPYVATAAGMLLRRRTYGASRVRHLPAVVGAASFAAIVLALMDPVVPYAEERVESRGIDIAIVLDLSSSMEEIMGAAPTPVMRRTRLDVTKRVISDFIARRPEDRIGLVVFSDNAYVVSPLTLDHPYLQRYVSMIDNQILRSEGMTAIGDGVTVANTLLSRQAAPDSRRNRVIVVFTDGENNIGRDPIQALGDARTAHVRVHLVGVDLEEEIKRKPEVLRLIRTVERNGGRYFTADTAGQLAEASRAIDVLEKGVVVSSRTVRNAPVCCSARPSRCVRYRSSSISHECHCPS
jgi:Ca-activated chloride channel homolog